MALSAFTGSLAQPTSTGNQSYTGVGFQPVVVLFFITPLTADGSAADAALGIGVAISSSARGSSAAISADNVGATDTAAGIDNSKCVYILSAAGAVLSAADHVSMDADGFTLNWTTADATQRIVNYIALGGADLTNVSTGVIQEPSATGNQSYTGAGFQPDSILLFAFRGTATAPPSNSAGGDFRLRLGFTTGTAEAHLNAQARTGQSAAVTNRYQRTASIYSRISDSSDAIAKEASIVSLDSDGFTLNWTTVDASLYRIFWVALKGGRFKVGSFNQATSTGNQGVTGVGFQPSGVVLASFNDVAATTVQTSARFSVGLASSSSARGCMFAGDTDAADPTTADTDMDRTKVIKMITEGTPTTDAAADFVSYDSDGFTINWSTADATAREIIYLAMGSTASGGTIHSVTVTDGIYMLDPQTKTEDHTLRDNPLLGDLTDPALLRQALGLDGIFLDDLMTKIEEHTLRDSPLLGDNVIRLIEIIQRDHLLLSSQDVGELLCQVIATDFLFLDDQRISNIDKTIADNLFFLDVMIKLEEKIIRDHLFLSDDAITEVINDLLDLVITDRLFLLDAAIKAQDATQQEGMMLADSPIKELHAVRAESLFLGDDRISELLRVLLDSILLRSDRASGVDLTQTDQLFIGDLYMMIREKLIRDDLFISDDVTRAVITAISAVLAYARTRSVDLLNIQAGSEENFLGIHANAEANLLGITIGWEIPSD